MTTHSLFHATDKAQCKTSWDKMQGTDSLRICPDCGARVYRLEGMAEEAAVELISANEPAPIEQLHLSRRLDGTFTTSNRVCTVLTLPAKSLNDWKESIPLVLRVLKASPRLTIALILMGITPLNGVLAVPMSIVALVIKCRIVKAYVAELVDEPWEPTPADNALYGPALLSYWLYYLVVEIGLFLLIVPGVIAAARGFVSLSLVCLERKGPVEALKGSCALTKEHAGEIIRYMAIPLAIYAITWIVPLACWLVLKLVMKAPIASFLMVFGSGIYALVLTAIVLTYIPLQVKVYARLKAEQAAKAVLVPAIAPNPGEQR